MKNSRIHLVESSAGHYYFYQHPTICPEGKYFPSITTILEAFPNKGLDFWKSNTSPDEIRDKQERGKMQGTKLHHCIDLGIKGHIISKDGVTREQCKDLKISDRRLLNYLMEPLTDRECKALDGVENFARIFEPKTVANEIIVVSLKHEYAGTCDWVGYLKNKEGKHELWVLDWKISNTKSRNNELQVVGYKRALLERFRYRKGLAKAKLGTVYFGMNKCHFSLSEVKDEKQVFNLFLSTKKLWHDANPKLPEFDTNLKERFAFNMQNKITGKLIKLN